MTGLFVRAASCVAVLAGFAATSAEARSSHSYRHGHHASGHYAHGHYASGHSAYGHGGYHLFRHPRSLAAGGAPAEAGGGSGGLATWYGPGFQGRKTASGERFNTGALTAAHRSLPFGTQVQVTNIANGRSVVVRINDRGPHRRGAVIDLSRASASAIGMGGTAPVRLARLN